MPTPKMISALAKLPFIDIPYAVAAAKYSGPVAALMDKLAKSTADTAKSMAASQFNWRIVYDRSADPPKITDEQAFLGYLTANSKSYLKASAGSLGKWIGYEELPFTPAQVLALYEQRAKLVCAQRRMAQEGKRVTKTPDDLGLVEGSQGTETVIKSNGQPLGRKIAAVVEMLRCLAQDLEKLK